MDGPSGVWDTIMLAVEGKDIKSRLPHSGVAKVLSYLPDKKMTFLEIYARDRHCAYRHFRDCDLFVKDPRHADAKWTPVEKLPPDHYLVIRGDPEVKAKFDAFYFGQVLRSTSNGTIVEVRDENLRDVLCYFRTSKIKERDMKTKKWKRVKATKDQLKWWRNRGACGCPDDDTCTNCKSWEENKAIIAARRNGQRVHRDNEEEEDSETFM
jgi:hypothetical protein